MVAAAVQAVENPREDGQLRSGWCRVVSGALSSEFCFSVLVAGKEKVDCREQRDDKTGWGPVS